TSGSGVRLPANLRWGIRRYPTPIDSSPIRYSFRGSVPNTPITSGGEIGKTPLQLRRSDHIRRITNTPKVASQPDNLASPAASCPTNQKRKQAAISVNADKVSDSEGS